MLLATVHGVYHMDYFQAVIIGLVQGLTELFPISSLGHTVLIPSWIGGSWATLVRQESQPESPYLAFIVGLHLATAVVLLGFYAREWVRLIAGFFRSLARRRVATHEERLAWLIVVATIPVGILGLALEHEFRVLFAKPLAAAIFLVVNGGVLVLGEWFHRHPRPSRTAVSAQHGIAQRLELPQDADSVLPASPVAASSAARRLRDDRIVPMDDAAERELARIGVPTAAIVGAAQALALLAGISREGVAMAGGMFRGLNRENALRFSFLLSTPVIFAAGALKVPDLLGPLGNGIRAQVVAGSLAAVATSLFAVIFLSRYFKTRTLYPFAVYSVLFGAASAIRFGIF
ncbi:MAG: undecaprenyl-diphosphate phosphatase [Acidimicrobiales bacterium]